MTHFSIGDFVIVNIRSKCYEGVAGQIININREYDRFITETDYDPIVITIQSFNKTGKLCLYQYKFDKISLEEAILLKLEQA